MIALRLLLSLVLLGAAAIHFVAPDSLVPAIPNYLPEPAFWVALTGWIEVLAACGLWVRRCARIVAAALMLYFVALLPAHLYVAMNNTPIFGLGNPWLWLRVPLQALFVAWAWLLMRDSGRVGASEGLQQESQSRGQDR